MAVLSQKMYVNDVDLSTLGLRVAPPQGWADLPAVSDTPLMIPGLAGGIITPADAVTGVRTVQVVGSFIASSRTLAQSQWDTIKKLLSGPELELRFEQWPDRVALARCQSVQWLPVGSHVVGARVALTFVMANPYLMGRQVEVYIGPYSHVGFPLTLGTAPSPVDLYLTGLGPGFGPPIGAIYLDAQGRERGRWAFDLTLALYDWIFIDGLTGIAFYYLRQPPPGPGPYNLASQYQTADTVPFVADPADGSAAKGPAIRPLNCTVTAHVRRQYR